MNHAGDAAEPTYSCHCLNVRVQSSPPAGSSPEPASATGFTMVYVAEDGVQVTHPQLALRYRTRGVPIAGTSECSQYMSLTCLVCHFLVYRVQQVIPADTEGKEGPILPTEQWVEAEIMKSSTGWIEIHEGCLRNNEIKERESSSEFSAIFSIAPPPSVSSSDPMQQPVSPPPSSPKRYLSEMRSLFPPPPFSPTHSVFTYLASFAISRSDQLRSAGEEYIAQLVREKIAEIEASESQLRQQVEVLWNKFKEGIQSAEEEKNANNSRSPFSPQRDAGSRDASASPSALSSVRDFVPLQIPPSRPSPPTGTPRMSSLSASLAMSSFHHPRYRGGRGSPPRSPSYSNGALSDSGSSITLTSKPGASSGSNVLQFRRNNNDAINTAASYRYFMNLEEEIARHKREQTATQSERSSLPEAETSAAQKTREEHHHEAHSSGDVSEKQNGEGAISPTSKGKRKVTFDVEPDVVTISQDATIEEDKKQLGDIQEMVFDLEDEANDRSPNSAPVLPLIEQPTTVRPRNRVNRKPNVASLPASLSALLPASLPASLEVSTSNYASERLPDPVTVQPASALVEGTQQSSSEVEEEEWGPRETEILKLVAANTPSHRGAWRKDGPAWKLFMNKRSRSADGTQEDDSLRLGLWEVDHPQRTADDLENSDDDPSQSSLDGMPKSLPIPINSLRPPPLLNLASYREQGALGEQQEQQRLPSSRLRRAAYAERDRRRSLDPGALDFTLAEDDEAENDEDLLPGSGNRGRNRALKILQARNSIPEAGMWRSLA